MKFSTIGVALTIAVSVCNGAPIINCRVKDIGGNPSMPKSILQSIFDTVSSMVIYRSKSINKSGPCKGKCHGGKKFRNKNKHLKHHPERLNDYHHEEASNNLL